MNKEPLWLKYAREIQSMAQTGKAFTENPYDLERYSRLNEIASEIVAGHSQLEKEFVHKCYLDQVGYATPKIDVRSTVIQDGKILLVKEKQDGKWALPGGWADVGDIPSQVAIRETKEESGFDVRVKKIIAVYDANRFGRELELYHAFKIIFLCELIGGGINPDHEILDVGFFKFEQLPELSQNRTNIKHINEIKEHLKNPERMTAFD